MQSGNVLRCKIFGLEVVKNCRKICSGVTDVMKLMEYLSDRLTREELELF